MSEDPASFEEEVSAALRRRGIDEGHLLYEVARAEEILARLAAGAERARIVAWLRAGAPGVNWRGGSDYLDEVLADAIERGEHEAKR
jgi:hypothetical protein